MKNIIQLLKDWYSKRNKKQIFCTVIGMLFIWQLFIPLIIIDIIFREKKFYDKLFNDIVIYILSALMIGFFAFGLWLDANYVPSGLKKLTDCTSCSLECAEELAKNRIYSRLDKVGRLYETGSSGNNYRFTYDGYKNGIYVSEQMTVTCSGGSLEVTNVKTLK